MRAVRHAIAIALLAAATCGPAAAQPPSELVAEEQPFVVPSAFSPNLHHVLYSEAWRQRPSLDRNLAALLPEPLSTEGLSAAERQHGPRPWLLRPRARGPNAVIRAREHTTVLAPGGEVPESASHGNTAGCRSSHALYAKYGGGDDRANRESATALLPA